MKAFLDHTGLLAFAHRGDHQSGPENTLAAFEGAVKKAISILKPTPIAREMAYSWPFMTIALIG